MLNRIFYDPIRTVLLSAPTIHGVKGINEPIVPITPETRDQLLERLKQNDEHLVCASCGSTKSDAYYHAIGAVTCCPDRRMVQAASLVGELAKYRQQAQSTGLAISDDLIEGAGRIAKFLGPTWDVRQVRYAREEKALPIRSKRGIGLYAFKSELTAALKDAGTLP